MSIKASDIKVQVESEGEVTAGVGPSLNFPANQSELFQNILTKVYIHKQLLTGLFKTGDNGDFFLSLQQLIQIFSEAVQDITQENDPNEPSEIPYAFSSPSFRVLLDIKCQNDLGKNHPGVYDTTSNRLCLNLKTIFSYPEITSIDDYRYELKLIMRHEFHHASKCILHAAFYKRPEMFIPCSYHIGNEGDFLYQDFFQRAEWAQAIYPFTTQERDRLIDVITADIKQINNTLLQETNPAKNDSLPIELFSNKHFIPRTQYIVDDSFSPVKLDNETKKVIMTAIDSGGSHCVQVTYSKILHGHFVFPICVQAKHFSKVNNFYFYSGFSVQDWPNQRPETFAWEVQWKLKFVRDGYQYLSSFLELDAVLYEFSNALYRYFFPNLNRLRTKEFARFSHSATEIEQCQSRANPALLELCLRNICINQFSTLINLDDTKHRTFVIALKCSMDQTCIVDKLVNNLSINIRHPEFLKTLDPAWADKQLSSGMFGNSEYILLNQYDPSSLYFRFFIAPIFPWYLFAAAAIFAFREEICNTVMNFLKPRAIPENTQTKASQNKEKADIAGLMQEDCLSIGYSCTEMALRTQVATDVAVVHDMVYYTKNHVKKQIEDRIKNKDQQQSYWQLGRTALAGCAYSFAGISWKYLASPIVTGIVAISNDVKVGYREGGVTQAFFNGLESYADHFIPGAHTVLSRQKTMLNQFDAHKEQMKKLKGDSKLVTQINTGVSKTGFHHRS